MQLLRTAVRRADVFSFTSAPKRLLLRRPLSLATTTTTTTKLGMPVSIDLSPPVNRWMKDKLDRDAFKKVVPVVAARVPAAKAGLILRAPETKRTVLDLPKIKTVIPADTGSDSERLVLLKAQTEADLTPEVRAFLDAQQAVLVEHKLMLNYDYWKADEILRAVLPEELSAEAPGGFAATGHLAHMNLNDEYLPYKYLIGQVILDKNSKITTVVNKLDSIDAKFRFFKMELIAGEPNYVVEHHESNCAFTFDFTQVYWNSRLHTEHDRLVQFFKPGDVVADVFAGVGPFAIPAAKKGCAVLANDLNPASYKYLQMNVDKNRVEDLVRPSCEDGREFIRAAARRVAETPFPAYTGPKPSRNALRAAQRKVRDGTASAHVNANDDEDAAAQQQQQQTVVSPPPRRAVDHFVMNLPDSAITFLDAFRGILSPTTESSGLANDDTRDLSGIYEARTPMVHCHCFTRELELPGAERDIRQRVEEKLGHALGDETSLHLVRAVAPNKHMYCISFRLPREVAFA